MYYYLIKYKEITDTYEVIGEGQASPEHWMYAIRMLNRLAKGKHYFQVELTEEEVQECLKNGGVE